jgi:hypothetical protein
MRACRRDGTSSEQGADHGRRADGSSGLIVDHLCRAKNRSFTTAARRVGQVQRAARAKRRRSRWNRTRRRGSVENASTGQSCRYGTAVAQHNTGQSRSADQSKRGVDAVCIHWSRAGCPPHERAARRSRRSHDALIEMDDINWTCRTDACGCRRERRRDPPRGTTRRA